MKKFSVILLIALFLFNLVGYRLLFTYEQQRSDDHFEAALDKQDYNDSDLIAIKVSLSLPYINNQQNFERVNGEITVNGKILKYVKRKISDGNLVLQCLPDQNKMRIESSKDEFFKYANDLVQHGQSRKSGNTKPGVLKNVLSEYDVNSSDCSLFLQSIAPAYNITFQSKFLPSSHCNLPEQPPEVTCFI